MQRMEDTILSWQEANPTLVDYEKLPTFWHGLSSLRVLINNKEVVDLKTPEGIRTSRKGLSLGVGY